MNVPMAIIF